MSELDNYGIHVRFRGGRESGREGDGGVSNHDVAAKLEKVLKDGGLNVYTRYSNPTVDDLFDELNEIVTAYSEEGEVDALWEAIVALRDRWAKALSAE